jgi:hypothetical protein
VASAAIAASAVCGRDTAQVAIGSANAQPTEARANPRVQSETREPVTHEWYTLARWIPPFRHLRDTLWASA